MYWKLKSAGTLDPSYRRNRPTPPPDNPETVTLPPPRIVRLVLVSTPEPQDRRTLGATDTITLSVDGADLSIRADVTGEAGSVVFLLDGVVFRTENASPHYLNGVTAGIPDNWVPSIGSHLLVATPYSGADGTGTAGEALSSTFSVLAEPPVTPPSDARPLNYVSPSYPFPKGPPRVHPYNFGTPNNYTGNYFSDSGQLAYTPDGSIPNDPGLAATRSDANYRGVIATSPQFDAYRGTPNPDPSTRIAKYLANRGPFPAGGCVAQVRATNITSNCAFVLWKDGRLTAAGTQTSGSTYPWLELPTNKVYHDLAVSSNNELAIIALYDPSLGKGQLAVVMVEGKGNSVHTFAQMGLMNQAALTAFKLLGYVDLPIRGPLKVAAACNGQWGGPSATGGKDLGQIAMGPSSLLLLYSGAWTGTIARAGYAVVTSETENKVVVVDFTALFLFIRESWLSSSASFSATTAARAAGTWPPTFDTTPAIRPTIAFTQTVTAPVSVIAGHFTIRFSRDRFKFHVGLMDGNVLIFDASKIMARFSWHPKAAAIVQMGSVFVGANPCSMAFSRRSEGTGHTLFAPSTTATGDGQNNLIWVVSRGAKKVVEILTVGGNSAILKTLEDQRMNDPVNVVTCFRLYVILVCDFAGKKIIGFRWGTIKNEFDTSQVYPPGPPGAPTAYEISGFLSIPGNPRQITSDNVN